VSCSFVNPNRYPDRSEGFTRGHPTGAFDTRSHISENPNVETKRKTIVHTRERTPNIATIEFG
jgi:hypothetical protein